MNIYDVKFTGMYPVPSGLIIAAENMKQAWELARKTVKHTDIKGIRKVNIKKPVVIFYESGDY